jgi:hypothetical protein
MELKFECPKCGQHISATPAQIGVTAPCPNCNTAVTVPNPSPHPQSPPPQPIPSTVRPQRTSRRWEAIGTLLVIGGLIVGIAGSGYGWFALMVGFVVFIIGRFID